MSRGDEVLNGALVLLEEWMDMRLVDDAGTLGLREYEVE